MPDIDLLTAFVLATAVFAYMPGPSTLYAAAQTLAGGRSVGLHAALGIHLGGYVHVVTAAMGLAVLFAAVPVLYMLLKLAGAAYLIWLGISFFMRAKQQDSDAVTTDIQVAQENRSFWQSATVEILNPKTAVFYVAFLPQFTASSAGLPIWAQLLVLGTVVNLMFSSADLICVFLAEKVNRALKQSSQANRVANRIGGGILVALGINLALTR